MVRIWLALGIMLSAGTVRAELNSLFPQASPKPDTATHASLFIANAQMGFFAPLPGRPQPAIKAPIAGTGTEPVDRLLSLIARAEAGFAEYDAVQHGARIKPAQLPTQMTLGEIYQWIDDTPGQPHAIGRYQFIPDTLRRVAGERGFGPETQFSAGAQDALAVVLLEDVNRPLFAGDPEVRILGYGEEQMWKQIFTRSARTRSTDGVRASGRI